MKTIITLLYVLSSVCFSQDFWKSTNGLYDMDIRSIVTGSDSYVFAGTGGDGVYISADNGNNWTQTNSDSVTINSLAVNQAGYIFAGWSSDIHAGGGIYRSTNNGNTWEEIFSTGGYNKITTLATDQNGYIFAGMYVGGVLYSTDYGNYWSQDYNNNLPIVSSLAINTAGYVFAGTHGGGIFCSTDNGINWTPINDGLTILDVSCLLNNSSGLFAGTWGGVFHYQDSTWIHLDNSLANVNSLTGDSMEEIFAGTADGVYKSMDYGYNWSEINNGLTDTNILSLAVSGDDYIFAGTSGSGVFRSIVSTTPVELISFTANSQATGSITLNWSTATETNNRIFEIERSKENENFVLIGSVEGKGTTTEKQEYSYIDKNVIAGKYFYRLKQIDFNGTFEYSNEIEVDAAGSLSFSLEQNYPNPFNPSTHIQFDIANQVNVKLNVYDILGREVATLIDKEMMPGKHNVVFNANGLSAGTYFYRLQTGGFVQTRKLTILK